MKRSFQEKFALFITYFFHPLLMPTIGMLIIMNSGTYISFLPIEIKRLVFYFIILTTCILPLLFMPIFKLQGIISNYTIDKRKERLLPLFIVTLLYFIGYYFFSRFTFIPQFIKLYVLALSITALITFMVTYKSKISIHMVGIGGIAGVLMSLIKFNAIHLEVYLILVFFIAGIIGFSRLKLNVHEPKQVYFGLFIGFCPIISILFFQ